VIRFNVVAFEATAPVNISGAPLMQIRPILVSTEVETD